MLLRVQPAELDVRANTIDVFGCDESDLIAGSSSVTSTSARDLCRPRPKNIVANIERVRTEVGYDITVFLGGEVACPL